MCYLNAFGSITLVMLYVWADPFADSDDNISTTQWCILPLVIALIPLTFVIDLIVFPMCVCRVVCCSRSHRVPDNVQLETRISSPIPSISNENNV